MKRSAPKRGGGRSRKTTGKGRGAAKGDVSGRRASERSTARGSDRSASKTRRPTVGRGLRERNRGIQRSKPYGVEREEEEQMATRAGRPGSDRGSEKQVGGRRRGARDDEDVVRDPGRPKPDEPAEGLGDEE